MDLLSPGPRPRSALDPSSGLPGLSDEMLASVLDQSQDCIKIIDAAGKIIYMNPNGQCAMEIDDFGPIASSHWWDLWPAESHARVRGAVSKGQAGEQDRFEAFCPTAKGSPRWWDVSVSPLRGDDGTIQGLLSVSRDITDRVADRELRETAAAEMRHRLQNAYALAGALVSTAARGGQPELIHFAEEVLGRLSKLGAAQRLLLESGSGGSASLSSLIERMLEPFSSPSCAVIVDNLPDVTVPEDDVRALALVFGELATNSSKYGAMGHGGTVRVQAEVRDKDVLLTWAEVLKNPVIRQPAAQGGGSGHRLVSRALAARGGAIDIRFLDGGLEATIRVPRRP